MRVLLYGLFLCLPLLKANAQVNDWENPQAVSSGTLAPHAHFIPFATDKEALDNADPAHRPEHDNSSRLLLLDGRWKFHLAKNPATRPTNFYKDEYSLKGWQDITVPANWQVQGFDRYIFTDVEYPIPPNPPFVPQDDNPVGSYRRTFTLPAAWKGKRIILHFGAVNSFFYVWINGRQAGFSKDSKTPAEFDITSLLKNGENSLSVQVFRFSDGTYLEGQDMWKLSGIERSVYLLARPIAAIQDINIQATLDNAYRNGRFHLALTRSSMGASSTAGRVRVQLLDSATTTRPLFEATKAWGSDTLLQFNSSIVNVRPWNAEQPQLYTLLITALDAKGHVIESIARQVGFRTVEIKNGLLLVNGAAIKLKGVNRHEFDNITGKVVSRASMQRDVLLMKEYNINAVRTSHYPNDAYWYELCDRYGLYVVDEANIECDGMSFSKLETLADKPEWKTAFLDRTRRMYERDKNFCSIITWSLGNESRFGENFIATYNYLKSVDSTRPVQYEEARELPYTDIVAPMYKSIGYLLEYVKTWKARPLIQCEYAHMMGNSGGNLKDYWDLINKYDQLQGGFIWDFSDQTFLRKDAKGNNIWAYGRDLGEVGLTSDTSFCADGLFASDRTPHPQAFELKKVYQPIQIESIPFSAGSVKLTNRYAFTNLAGQELYWTIKANGQLIATDSFILKDQAPGQSRTYQLPLPHIQPQPGTEYFLMVAVQSQNEANALTIDDSQLVPPKREFTTSWEQFSLPLHQAQEEAPSTGPALYFSNTSDSLVYKNELFAVAFSKKTGWLSSFSMKGAPLFQSPLQPHFWRAPADNDIGNSQQIRCAVWQTAPEQAILTTMHHTENADGSADVHTMHSLPTVEARYEVHYHITPSGKINITIKMQALGNNLPELPRFGMRVLLPSQYDKATWFGRGPFDNYIDRKEAAAVDLYTMPADQLFHPYARAQESGYRTEVRWMQLQNKVGYGIKATGTPLISTGVLHFHMDHLEFDRHAPANNHGGSMQKENLIWWNIDGRQMGVGGDNSWGAKPHAEYQLPYHNYQYSFTLEPVSANPSTPQ